MRPPIFVLRDLWPAGALFAVLLAALAACLGLHAGWGFSVIVGIGCATAGVGYGRTVLARRALALDVVAVTPSGLRILNSPMLDFTNGALAPMEAETLATLAKWDPVVSDAAHIVRGTYVIFMPFPFELKWLPGAKLAGHVELDWRGVRGAACIQLGWKPIIAETALGHELGHIILIGAENDTSEERLETMAKLYGVPY